MNLGIGWLVRHVAHRPWPVPNRPWFMAMTWQDLLFAHWPVTPEAVRPLVPVGLALDTFEGMAWVGVVPFRMAGVRARWLPPCPGLSAFPELNVRTYVVAEDRPGVWFFSLDAANPVAVVAARATFHLPYRNARMRCQVDGPWIDYTSTRTHSGVPPATFVARYRPTGEAAPPPRGSLADWLTARYRLYSADGAGNLHYAEIHHLPWPLQPAEAEIRRNTMAEAAGIALPHTPPLLHFTRRLDVVGWSPARLEARSDRLVGV